MNKFLISKEEFTSYINEIKRAMNYQKELNRLYGKYQVGMYDDHPDCVASLIQLLNKIMKVSEQDKYIERFCFDTDFGKKQLDGVFYDANMREVTISSSDDLYDLLENLA